MTVRKSEVLKRMFVVQALAWDPVAGSHPKDSVSKVKRFEVIFWVLCGYFRRSFPQRLEFCFG